MGTLRYGMPERAWTVDDRALAHLRVVIIDKLRHGETFAFSCAAVDTATSTTFWMTPGIPLRFEFAGAAVSEINRWWVRALMRTACTAEGLRLVAEPPALHALPTPAPPYLPGADEWVGPGPRAASGTSVRLARLSAVPN